MKWSLGNGKDIHFWTKIWLTDSPLLNYVLLDKRHQIDITNKIRDFIDHNKTWQTQNLTCFFARYYLQD